MATPLRRIPGGDFYTTCVHIKSKVNPRTFVFSMDRPPQQLRDLVNYMRYQIDRLGKSKWCMICMDCYHHAPEKGGLENGAPYDIRQAHGDIVLGN